MIFLEAIEMRNDFALASFLSFAISSYVVTIEDLLVFVAFSGGSVVTRGSSITLYLVQKLTAFMR